MRKTIDLTPITSQYNDGGISDCMAGQHSSPTRLTKLIQLPAATDPSSEIARDGGQQMIGINKHILNIIEVVESGYLHEQKNLTVHNR